MKYFLIILIFFSNIITAQNSVNKKKFGSKKTNSEFRISTPSCDELIYYRDKTLAKDFKSAFDKHQINYEGLEHFNKTKDELLNERGWDELMTLGYSTSENGVKIAQIAQVIKTGCDLISDAVGLIPTGESTLINKSVSTSEKVYKQIKLGKDIKKIVNSEAGKVVYYKILDEFNLVGKSAKMALHFSDNLKKLVKIPEERQNLKEEVEGILNMLENSISIYQQKVDESSADIKEINGIVDGIDKYLFENCDNTTAEKSYNSITKSKKTSSPIIKDKKMNGNSFYVFFHISVSINNKLTDIISAPILYNGKLTDQMSKQKEDFINQIEMEFLNKPKHYKDAIKYINTESITIHYGKTYSKILLRTKNDAFDAIESFKIMMKESVEGIGEIDFIEIE